jgi:hypothetical protein
LSDDGELLADVSVIKQKFAALEFCRSTHPVVSPQKGGAATGGGVVGRGGNRSKCKSGKVGNKKVVINLVSSSSEDSGGVAPDASRAKGKRVKKDVAADDNTLKKVRGKEVNQYPLNK